MKNHQLFLVLSMLGAVGCEQPTDVLHFDGFTVNCLLDDCSEWTEDSVVELLDNYQLRWDVLFPDERFVPAKNWYIEKEENLDCRWLPDTPWTMPDCGGYAHGEDIFVQGTLQDVLLTVYMAPVSHELTHNALRVNTGNGDPNHAEEGGPWTKDHDRLINVMSRLGCDDWAERFLIACDY